MTRYELDMIRRAVCRDLADMEEQEPATDEATGAEQWEVIEGVYSGVRGEFSIWPVGAQGDGNKRIACWIRTCEIADLLCAAPNLLAACKAVRDWILDEFYDPAELSDDAKRILAIVSEVISDAKGGE